MSERNDRPTSRGPRLGAKGAAARAAREARLAEALRANLRRRKAQLRGRDEAAAVAGPESGAPPVPLRERKP
ncbi:MAG: hypothetical protein D6826_11600 [Alphaproteobacteria bacterium]|nr:MAG: hypothetical protein D6826_11600 [Alphaproteobacteria bacterium]